MLRVAMKKGLFLTVSILMFGCVDAAELPTCAVLALSAKTGVTADQADLLTDRLISELGEVGGYRLMSRDQMSQILAAQQFSRSENCQAAECAVEAGKMLAIQYVVFGSVGSIGRTYTVNVHLADVESGETVKTANYDVQGDIDEVLTRGMQAVARKLMGVSTPLVAAVHAPGDAPAGRGGRPEFLERSWTNSLGMEFVPVPGVNVLFCKWETRRRDFEVFVQATGYAVPDSIGTLRKDGVKWRKGSWKDPGFPQGPTHPVVGLSPEDVDAFCRWLTGREHSEGRMPQARVYRTPFDWEWSVAVGLDEPRAGTPGDKAGRIKGEYPWGSQWPPPRGAGNYAGEELSVVASARVWNSIVGYDDGYPTTAPVGSFPANRFGLFDMGGNVWEYCEDAYGDGKGSRAQRGASWMTSWNGDNDGFGQVSTLSCSRNTGWPNTRYADQGFRVVIAPAP